jgi:hypothetical protein
MVVSLISNNLSAMQVESLKYMLLDKLILVNDQIMLTKINELIGTIDLNETIFTVSDQQHQMLKPSKEDIQKGNLISDETVNEEEDSWLNG